MTPDEYALKPELGYTPEEWARLLSHKLSATNPQSVEEAQKVYAEVIGAATRAAELTALEKAARVAERPIRGNGHSPETYLLSGYAVETARMIRDLKGPQYLPPRRLK